MLRLPLKWRSEMLHKLFLCAKGERGVVLPFLLTFILVFAIEIAGLGTYASSTFRQARSQMTYLKTFYAAEAANERSFAQIRLFIQKQGTIPQSGDLNTMKNRTISFGGLFTTNSAGGSTLIDAHFPSGGNTGTTKRLTIGTYKGLNATTYTIDISAMARDLKGFTPSNVRVSRTIEIQAIPIFQFTTFAQDNLEILPGANMTLTGPVHTNSSMYLGSQAGTNLAFSSSVTAAENIFHGRLDSSSAMEGNVFIKDVDPGVDQNMKNPGGGWLDSNDANWLLGAIDRWDGNVGSSVHGIQPLNLPFPEGVSTQTLIDRRSASDQAALVKEKMDYKANIRIIDGVVYDQPGNTINLTYCSGGGAISNNACPQGETLMNPVKATSFYNFREGKTIQSTDIDVAVLNNSPAFQAIVNSTVSGVVIYTSDRRNSGSSVNQDAVRLLNGAQLPAKGMTVSSENPIYVKGDYNTVNKQPAGVMGDSFNILSNNWNDSNSTAGLGSRAASQTTVKTAVIAGVTLTTPGSQYSGGLENFPRFLENWTGVNMNYDGSLTLLYNSRQAIGAWIYGGNYYTAPIRNWSFDTDLSGTNYNVPGFPSVINVEGTAFDQKSCQEPIMGGDCP